MSRQTRVGDVRRPHARGRVLARAAVATVAVLALVGLDVGAALADAPRITHREPVFGGLTHERFTVTLRDGAVARGDILRYREDDPHLELRSVMARDRVAGLETTESMASRELDNGAIAGTNGGFGLPRPYGAPNGFAVQDGFLLGAQGQTLNGFRRTKGTVGVLPGGAVLMDQLDTTVHVRRPDGTRVSADEVNLHPRLSGETNVPTGELIVYDHRFGTSVQIPAGSTLVVLRDVPLAPSQAWVSGTVDRASTHGSATSYTVPPGATALLAHGDAVPRLAGLAAGDTVSLRTLPGPLSTDPAQWGSTEFAVPGGPLLMRNGRHTRREEWGSQREGFNDSLLTSRHPRTAIVRTFGGEILLVTVDGRRAGHSVGMSMPELQRLVTELNAQYALNLDGGGSTTMTVEGAIRNRPSEGGRSVPNALMVYHSYPFDATERIAGDDRYATAADVARRSYPDGADTVVIATGTGFPDALAGGPLAAHRGAPLLLTRPDRIPGATLRAIDALRPSTALVLGGSSAIGGSVVRELQSRVPRVRRIAGDDRYETAGKVGRELTGSGGVERVFVAAGTGFADALSAAAPAGMMGAPVLLTRGDRLPDDTRSYLRERSVGEIVVVGGTSVVRNAVMNELRALKPSASVTRLGGDDRYHTSRLVNEWAERELQGHDPSGLVVANGTNFPDALAGGPLAASGGHLLTIVPPRDALSNRHSRTFVEARGPALDRITLLGGHRVLSSFQQWQLDQVALR